LKGSLCGSGQPIWASFKREKKRFSCSNLETAKSPETAKSQFEQDSNMQIFVSLSQTETSKSCLDPQRLPFKDSLLLQNLVGPGSASTSRAAAVEAHHDPDNTRTSWRRPPARLLAEQHDPHNAHNASRSAPLRQVIRHVIVTPYPNTTCKCISLCHAFLTAAILPGRAAAERFNLEVTIRDTFAVCASGATPARKKNIMDQQRQKRCTNIQVDL